jgi:hypothetical protein
MWFVVGRRCPRPYEPRSRRGSAARRSLMRARCPCGHQKTVVPTWSTARGCVCGGGAAPSSARRGHRSPVEGATARRPSARGDGAAKEMHSPFARSCDVVMVGGRTRTRDAQARQSTAGDSKCQGSRWVRDFGACENGQPMRLDRGLLFWGLALITTGAVALAVEFRYVDRDVVSGAWRLWPQPPQMAPSPSRSPKRTSPSATTWTTMV